MKSVLLALSVATISLSLAACGPTPDPSKNNANNENNSTMNNTSTNSTMNNTSTNSTMNNTSTNSTMNNTSTNNTSTNNTMVGPCEVSTTFFGQIDSDFDDHAGGAPTTDPITTDAGLGAAMTEWENLEGGETATVDLAVTGAIVTATNFGNGGNVNFWVEDANAVFEFQLGFDGCAGGACANNPIDGGGTIKVGDEVNFTITELENYFDTAQISAVSDFTVESSGNAVPYTDLTGQTIDVAAYKGRLVRVGGRLSETSEPCGPAECFDMMHGDEVAQYRIDADNSNTFGGDCVTFFGPLSEFQGTPSLDVTNFAWRLPIFE